MATVYPKGIKVFQPSEKAPSYVLGKMVISLNELVKYANENPDFVTMYKDEPQLTLNIMDGDKGVYVSVDTYKKQH